MIDELFEQNQNDLTLSDVGVQWVGGQVRLYAKYPGNGSTLGLLTSVNVVAKIKRFCVKTNHRCSQIQNGKVML